MSLSVQWWTMATMLMSGIGMGIVFDGYRVVSDELRISRWWIPVFDLLYWIAATIVVFQVLSASNEGEVRAYVFLGLLIGIGCYYWVLSKPVVLMVHGIIRIIRILFQFTIKLVNLLVIRPVVLLFRLSKLIFAFFLAFALFLSKVVLQLVRPFWIMIRWMTSPLVKPLVRWLASWGAPLLDKWQVRRRVQAAADYPVRLWRKWTTRKKDGGGTKGT